MCCRGPRRNRSGNEPRGASASGERLGTLVSTGNAGARRQPDAGGHIQERFVDLVALAPILLLVVAFYFLLIRPQKMRQKQQAAMVAALAPGAQVMTTAGMIGTVAVVADDEISLEISPGVFVRMVPAAVARVIEPAPGSTMDAPPDSGSPSA